MVEMVGLHALCDLHDCDKHILDDPVAVERIMLEAQHKQGAKVLNVYTHKFTPQGVTCVVQVSESHLAIHTWPELGYQQVDVFTCGNTNVLAAQYHVMQALKPQHHTLNLVRRGAEAAQPQPVSHIWSEVFVV